MISFMVLIMISAMEKQSLNFGSRNTMRNMKIDIPIGLIPKNIRCGKELSVSLFRMMHIRIMTKHMPKHIVKQMIMQILRFGLMKN